MVAQESKALRLAIDSSPLWDIDLEIRRPFFKAMKQKMLRDNDDEVVEIPTLSPENEKLCKTVWAQVMMLGGKTDPFIVSVAFFKQLLHTSEIRKRKTTVFAVILLPFYSVHGQEKLSAKNKSFFISAVRVHVKCG